MAITVKRRAFFGVAGNSISTVNAGTSVQWYPPLRNSLRSLFTSGSAPNNIPGSGTYAKASGTIASYDTGAPIWYVSATAGQNISVIRTFIQNLPPHLTHFFMEGGTNDTSNAIPNATSQSDLNGCFTDAIARFPGLVGIFVIGVCVIGEKYGVDGGGVPTFQGNSFDGAGTNIDGKNAALLATCQAANLTNARGQPCPVVWVDTRTPAALFEKANGPAPPGVDGGAGNGVLTIDNKHPRPGGMDVVVSTAVLNNMTIDNVNSH